MQRALVRNPTVPIEWPAVAVALLGALALAGCDGGADGGKAAAAPPPPEVTVAHPRVENLVEWTEFTGRFEAVQQVDIRARVSGYLATIDFQDGEVVNKGQNLFLIDPRPFEAALDRARADLASAQAQLELAKLQFERVAKLVGSPAFAQTNYDQRLQERRAAEASVGAAQAAVEQAKLNLDYTEISAPISGRISDRRVDVGNLGHGDQRTLLTTIVSLDPIYFDFDMSEARLPRLSAGGAGGRAALHPRQHDPGQRQAGRRRRLAAAGPDELRRQPGRPELGHDPRARRVPQPERLDHSPASSADPHPGLAGIPGDADPRRGDRDRPVAKARDDGRPRTARSCPKVIRPGPHELGLRIVRKGLTADDTIIINGLVRVAARAAR